MPFTCFLELPVSNQMNCRMCTRRKVLLFQYRQTDVSALCTLIPVSSYTGHFILVDDLSTVLLETIYQGNKRNMITLHKSA